jgi:hypothetical protein
MALMEEDKNVLGLLRDISNTPRRLIISIKRREDRGLFMSGACP